MPSMPIRNIKDNPRGYRSPTERNINYTTIKLLIPDAPEDYVLGWYMKH